MRVQWHAVAGIVRKDLLLFTNNRTAMMMSFVAPIAIAAFIGMITDRRTGASSGAKAQMQVLVIDDDGTDLSREVIAAMDEDELIAVVPSSEEIARDLVRRGKAFGAVRIPKGFSEKAVQGLFGAGALPEILIWHDPSREADLGMVRGLLTQHVMSTVSRNAFQPREGLKLLRSAREQVANAAGADINPARKLLLGQMFDSMQRWMEQSEAETKAKASTKSTEPETASASASASTATSGAGGMRLPFTVREVAVTASEETPFNSYAHSFAGMSVQFLLFAALDLGIALLVERRGGHWQRLRSAPVSRSTVILAKMLSGALIATAILLVCYAAAITMFGVRISGNRLGFALVVASIALFASSFGLLLATLGNTPETTRGMTSFVVLVLVMLGGAWFPTIAFPGWVQTLTHVVPTRWAVDGLESVTWRGLDFAAAAACAGYLSLFTLAFFLIVLWRFRWSEP